MAYKGYNISVRGASHVDKGSICQDYSGHVCGEGFCAAVVSDGHGGESHFRSGIGAKMAVGVSLEAVKEFVGSESEFLPGIEKRYKTVLKQLAACISARWADAVLGHLEENPVTEAEMEAYEKYYSHENAKAGQNATSIYGATLVIGAIANGYAFVVQIGDGACVVRGQGGACAIPPETSDERLFLGYTTSLCDPNSLGNFRFFFTKDAPAAIVLATDGVADSYDGCGFLKFCQALCDLFVEGYDEAYKHLSEWLPKLSALGSKDDMSVAGIYRLE